MIEKTTYMCEVCGSIYAKKDFAEACEKLGVPKEYNRNIGKWFLAPVQIFFHEEKENCSNVTSKIDWRLVRVDGNEIVGNKNMEISSFLNLETIAHRINYKIRTFEDGSMLIKDLFDQKIEMDGTNSHMLNLNLVSMEQGRIEGRKDFEQWQHDESEKLVKQSCIWQNISLPEIKGIEKYYFSNEIKNV